MRPKDLQRMGIPEGAPLRAAVEIARTAKLAPLVLQEGLRSVVDNPGAHTHYSYALRDALGSVNTPCVEVHISDVSTREAFRHISVIAPACVAQVKGRGFAGYNDALDILLEGVTERLGEGFEGRYAPGQVIVAGRDLIDE